MPNLRDQPVCGLLNVVTYHEENWEARYAHRNRGRWRTTDQGIHQGDVGSVEEINGKRGRGASRYQMEDARGQGGEVHVCLLHEYDEAYNCEDPGSDHFAEIHGVGMRAYFGPRGSPEILTRGTFNLS